MRPRVIVLLLALTAVPTALLAACSDDEPATTTAAEGMGPRTAGLPFPPTAQEPATAPEPETEPTGEVFEVGPELEGVAVVDGVAGVALQGGGLALVDVATGDVRETVELPSGARHVQPGDGEFLVPLEDADSLAQVSPEGEAQITEVGDNPHDAAVLDDGQIVVGDEFSSTATFVRDGEVVRTVPVDVQPGGVAPLGDVAALISVRANTIQLLDAEGERPEGSQNAGYGPSHAVTDEEGRVYITDTRGDAVLVFETQPRVKAVGRIELPGSPYGIGIDRERDRLFVTTVGNNTLHQLTLGNEPRETAAFPTVRQPNTLGVDPATGRVVIASRTDGTVQLLDP